MPEPLVVTLTLDAVATRVTLWQAGARRLEERLVHGALALAAANAPPAAVRRSIRLDAVAGLLAGFGEDGTRPDAFVALGAGAHAAGVYAAHAPDDAPAADGAALAHALSARAGVPGYVVEPLGSAPDDAELVADPVRALLVRAALRRDAREHAAPDDATRLVVLAEPAPLVCASRGPVVVAAVEPLDGLPGTPDAGHLLRRAEQGDAAVAAVPSAYAVHVVRAARAAVAHVERADVVLLIGSLVLHAAIADPLTGALRTFAPVRLRPGGRVDRALADAALAVLDGREPVRSYG